MTEPRRHPDPQPADDPTRAPDHGHGRHGLMMIACCIPMLAIAGLLVATGVAGSGFIVAALACTAMMAAMMFAMPGSNGRE